MKARLVILFFLLPCVAPPLLHGQIVQRKSNTVEVYYGIPDWWHSWLRYDLNSNVYSLNIQSTGPWGARYEHMLNRRVGLGADIWYVSTSFTGLYNQTSTSGTSPNSSIVSFNGKLSRLNALLRMTLHLSSHEKLDPYVHFGFGYLYSNYHFQSTNKSVYDQSNALPPVTIRFGMGLKYYFSQDFGTFIDVGIGGPLVSIGIFTRWRKKWEE